MSEEFLFPDVGEGIAEGKLVEWKVGVGDSVAEDQVVADVETDKAVVEIPSPRAGTIKELKFEPGDTINVGDVLLTFGEVGTSPQEQPALVAEEPAEPKTKDYEVKEDHERSPERGTKKVESSLTPTAPTPEEHEPPITVQEQTTDAQGPVEQHTKRVLAAPSTRRLARERGVDLKSLQGSGPAGRVLASDVEAAASGELPAKEAKPSTPPVTSQKTSEAPKEPAQERQAPVAEEPASATTPSTGTRVEYSGRRKAIGKHMEASNSVPAVTEFATADATALVELREHLKDKAQQLGVKLTYLAFFSKAVCAALRKYPVLNSHFKDESITLFDDVHLGLAVDTEQGLVVPVIRGADKKSALEVAAAIESLATKARSNELSAAEMSGSTFSISSIGKSRVEFFTPMINTPETAILGIGGFKEEARVVDEEVLVRTVVPLSVSYDHRVVDGAEAARFLTYLVELIEDPELLVLGGI